MAASSSSIPPPSMSLLSSSSSSSSSPSSFSSSAASSLKRKREEPIPVSSTSSRTSSRQYEREGKEEKGERKEYFSHRKSARSEKEARSAILTELEKIAEELQINIPRKFRAPTSKIADFIHDIGDSAATSTRERKEEKGACDANHLANTIADALDIFVNALDEFTEDSEITIGKLFNGLGKCFEFIIPGLLPSASAKAIAEIIEELPEKSTAHTIANVLHAVGKYFEYGSPEFRKALEKSLSTKTLASLVKQLEENESRNKNALSISLTFHGIGKLFAEGSKEFIEALDKQLSTTKLASLLNELDKKQESMNKGISISLFAIGEMFENGTSDFRRALSEKLSTTRITSLLERIKKSRTVNAQSISSSLRGLGKIFRHGEGDFTPALENKLRTNATVPMLVKQLLTVPDTIFLSVAISLQGIGDMFESSSEDFKRTLIAELVASEEVIFKKLRDLPQTRGEKSISSCLNAFSTIVRYGLTIVAPLERSLVDFTIVLINRLADDRYLTPPGISGSLTALGNLLEGGTKDFSETLARKLPVKKLNVLFNCLLSCPQTTTRCIVDSLYAVGKLFKYGPLSFQVILSKELAVETVGEMFALLLQRLDQGEDQKPRFIANGLMAYGRMVEFGTKDFSKKLAKTAVSTFILSFDQLVTAETASAEDISTSLYAYGVLFEHGREEEFRQRLAEGMSVEKLTLLFARLNKSTTTHIQDIVWPSYALGKTIEYGTDKVREKIWTTEPLLRSVTSLSEKLYEQRKKADCQSITMNLHALANMEYPHIEMFKKLFIALQTHLNDHPDDFSIEAQHQVAYALGYYVVILKRPESELALSPDILHRVKNLPSPHSTDTHKILHQHLSTALAGTGCELKMEEQFYGFFIDTTVRKGDIKIAIEIEGDVHQNKLGELLYQEKRRHNFLSTQGWRVHHVLIPPKCIDVTFLADKLISETKKLLGITEFTTTPPLTLLFTPPLAKEAPKAPDSSSTSSQSSLSSSSSSHLRPRRFWEKREPTSSEQHGSTDSVAVRPPAPPAAPLPLLDFISLSSGRPAKK